MAVFSRYRKKNRFAMPETAAKPKPAKVETNAYSLMAARFWHGMTPSSRYNVLAAL
jgi:hypothetical protein